MRPTDVVVAEKINLVAAHTNRLRCSGCHRFIGTAGTVEVPCERCDVVYLIRPNGLYARLAR